MKTDRVLRIGSRGSPLAVIQAEWMGRELQRRHPKLKIEYVRISTTGDKNLGSPLQSMGGKGAFVKEIEEALLSHQIDLAVHSLKDVPQILPPGLKLGPFPKREDPRDVVITRNGEKLSTLKKGARVGTSSPRRIEQLKRLYKNRAFRIESIRGNVDTRIRKVKEGLYDSVVMALAGVRRLGLENEVTEILDPHEFRPAPGQGCLGLELRIEDEVTGALLEMIKDTNSDIVARAERSFLQALGGNCLAPVASLMEVKGDHLETEALLFDPLSDWSITAREGGPTNEAELIGAKLAGRILYEGGSEILLTLDRLEKPLAGKAVVTTRPRAQSENLSMALLQKGARVISCPSIAIKSLPPDAKAKKILKDIRSRPDTYDWIIFLSENGVRTFVGQVGRISIQSKICAVGPQTASILHSLGLRVDAMPEKYSSARVAKLLKIKKGQRILIPRVQGGPKNLTQEWKEKGALVDEINLYQTIAATPPSSEIKKMILNGVDAILFTSSSTAMNFMKFFKPKESELIFKKAVAVSMGPNTTSTLKSLGVKIVTEAKQATVDSLVEAVIRSVTHDQSFT